MNYSGSPFGGLTPIVKNLLIINVLFYIASIVIQSSMGLRLEHYLGLHVPMADNFRSYQLITYMFLHAYPGFAHLFFNMFALFMFGRMLETVWGPKRFLFYYFATGVGAALIHLVTQYIEIMPSLNAINSYLNNANPDTLQVFINEHLEVRSHEMRSKFNAFAESYNALLKTDPESAIELSKQYIYEYRKDYLNTYITIGASGAVFGILLAFGMLFPDARLMLLFPPIPIKAKYFVIIYGAIELWQAIVISPFSNVAHFAHLGGMLFGYLLIKYWRSKGLY
ncbi:rhomboid family intramembrane serine protease [Marinilabiliaceae bacterium ANBcel2]|nr:rhomboid family intramembrane serine protease [Marinilabiliaceae bacterium ANBcel2]